jgi:hypothetical protein
VIADAPNKVVVTVDPGPAGVSSINGLFVTVTLCVPGTTTCQTFDHFVVDTGSVGVRVLGSELTLALPSVANDAGNRLVECLPFVSGTAWGPLATADVKVGGETATNIPIQVIDERHIAKPTACTGSSVSTVQTLVAKGILGVGVTLQDCGSSCAQPTTSAANPGLYYACTAAGACTETSVPAANQIPNPVGAFPVDNNGTMISLPAIDAKGESIAQGTMTFGIGTQSNNGLGNATVLPLDQQGLAITTFPVGGDAYTSYIDSGSNGLFFLNSTLTGLQPCKGNLAGFYCPSGTVSAGATMSALNGAHAMISFSVVSAATLSAADAAFSDLAGEIPGFPTDPGVPGFDWGIPFFFGRNVYTAIETRGTPAGPYFAF